MSIQVSQRIPVPLAAPVRLASERKQSEPTWTNGTSVAGTDVAWYQKGLNRVPQTAQKVLKEYSGIKEEELVQHVCSIRDQAWKILPYPCVGLFRFLDFPAYLSNVYPEVLERVKNGAMFLDLGCCFGQDIRKLVHDGAPASNILGADKEGRFLELGYDLFRDRDSLGVRFYEDDIFDDRFLEEWTGKLDIVFVGSFLHLFTFEQQTKVVAQIQKLLKPDVNTLVFGRHMSMKQGGIMKENACGWSVYHHSSETIRQLWDTTSQGTWEVASNVVPYASEAWDNGSKWQGNDGVEQQYFSARRVA